jgi:hypothetical protein
MIARRDLECQRNAREKSSTVRNTRFIFVEGIMGAGKTTATEWLAGYRDDNGVWRQGYLECLGARTRLIAEDGTPRVSLTLAHPNAVWQDVSIEEFFSRSLALWRSVVAHASEDVTICDGLLFHGNLTDLFLMDAPPERLRSYVVEVLATLAPLRPSLIYLRYEDLAEALRTLVGESPALRHEGEDHFTRRQPLLTIERLFAMLVV